ncbi:plasminogen-like [Saccoglossus kowalevskii]
MAHWENETCIRFKPYTEHLASILGHHGRIRFTKGNGCWSFIGMIKTTTYQELSLGPGCANKGTIVHELGHVIGFWHEQSRLDRDNYVEIHWENIEDGQTHNFQKYGANEGDSHGIPYDVGSAMHYYKTIFSKNGSPTITAINPEDNSRMGNHGSLTYSDILLANLMYPCGSSECTVMVRNNFMESVKGEEYRGMVHKTYTGIECQKWTSQTPHSHEYDPESYPAAGLGDNNYCRNPSGYFVPWCFTTDPNMEQGSCDVGLPGDKCALTNCYAESDGRDYKGSVDTTENGKTCQNWLSQTPHAHNFSPVTQPDRGIGNHNFCRNPDDSSGPWCFTTDPNTEREYCDVGSRRDKCSECTVSPNGDDYRGGISVTATGKTCQKWTSQYPHSHTRTPENYPGTGLGNHNYCRNPDNEDRAWCYTTDPGTRWAVCDTSFPGRYCDFAECYARTDASDYRGTVSTTTNGRTCQKWNSQSPHSHSNTPEARPDSGLGNHNYCRNSDGEVGAWCYTTDPGKRWELCDVGPPGGDCSKYY